MPSVPTDLWFADFLCRSEERVPGTQAVPPLLWSGQLTEDDVVYRDLIDCLRVFLRGLEQPG
jgi:hypothetical protein